MSTFLETETFVVEHCCDCGVAFAMTESMRNRFRSNGGSFYCPNGHGQYYAVTEVQRLKDELNASQKRLTAIQFELAAERSAREQVQKKNKRLEKRASVGMCPCCNRQFVNMQRHMKTKHPGYVDNA